MRKLGAKIPFKRKFPQPIVLEYSQLLQLQIKNNIQRLFIQYVRNAALKFPKKFSNVEHLNGLNFTMHVQGEPLVNLWIFSLQKCKPDPNQNKFTVTKISRVFLNNNKQWMLKTCRVVGTILMMISVKLFVIILKLLLTSLKKRALN